MVDGPDIEGNGAIVSNDEPRRKVQNEYLDQLSYRCRSPCAIRGIATQATTTVRLVVTRYGELRPYAVSGSYGPVHLERVSRLRRARIIGVRTHQHRTAFDVRLPRFGFLV